MFIRRDLLWLFCFSTVFVFLLGAPPFPAGLTTPDACEGARDLSAAGPLWLLSLELCGITEANQRKKMTAGSQEMLRLNALKNKEVKAHLDGVEVTGCDLLMCSTLT